MFDRLMNRENEPLLEQMAPVTAQRHKLIAENVVNLRTPNYKQKDLSLEKFQACFVNGSTSRRGSPGRT